MRRQIIKDDKAKIIQKIARGYLARKALTIICLPGHVHFIIRKINTLGLGIALDPISIQVTYINNETTNTEIIAFPEGTRIDALLKTFPSRATLNYISFSLNHPTACRAFDIKDRETMVASPVMIPHTSKYQDTSYLIIDPQDSMVVTQGLSYHQPDTMKCLLGPLHELTRKVGSESFLRLPFSIIDYQKRRIAFLTVKSDHIKTIIPEVMLMLTRRMQLKTPYILTEGRPVSCGHRNKSRQSIGCLAPTDRIGIVTYGPSIKYPKNVTWHSSLDATMTLPGDIVAVIPGDAIHVRLQQQANYYRTTNQYHAKANFITANLGVVLTGPEISKPIFITTKLPQENIIVTAKSAKGIVESRMSANHSEAALFEYLSEKTKLDMMAQSLFSLRKKSLSEQVVKDLCHVVILDIFSTRLPCGHCIHDYLLPIICYPSFRDSLVASLARHFTVTPNLNISIRVSADYKGKYMTAGNHHTPHMISIKKSPTLFCRLNRKQDSKLEPSLDIREPCFFISNHGGI